MINTPHGEFRLIAYASEVDGGESHWRWCAATSRTAPTRFWSACTRTACWAACSVPPAAIAAPRLKLNAGIAAEGRGALIYLHQTSKDFPWKNGGTGGSELPSRPAAAGMPESERKTQREIGIGAQILPT